MSLVTIAGIDPGLQGAIAIVQLEIRGHLDIAMKSVIKVFDMPVALVDSGKLPDMRRLEDVLRQYSVDAIAMEWPGPRNPNEKDEKGREIRSYKSEWRFAIGCGLTLSTCLSTCQRVVLYAPRSWKSALKLSRDKGGSIDLARSLVSPEVAAAHFEFASKDGRAEAFLVAEHLRRQMCSGKPVAWV